jgi:hypothetical protein
MKSILQDFEHIRRYFEERLDEDEKDPSVEKAIELIHIIFQLQQENEILEWQLNRALEDLDYLIKKNLENT